MILDGVKVIYGIYDNTIDEDTPEIAHSSVSDYAQPAETLNTNITNEKVVYAEQDYFLLDGTFTFPVSGQTYHTGYESENISDSSGAMSEYIEYIFTNTHANYGIQITFAKDCIVEEFTITYYADSTVVGTDIVTGNTSETYSDYNSYISWNKVRITFTKVNPYQRARLWILYFGINDIYTEDLLISVSASRKTDITGDYSDCGDFSFQFYNNGRFNVKNLKDLPLGVQEDLLVDIYVKQVGDSNYIHFGKYYSEDTAVEEDGKIITISGYDLLYRLNDTTYSKGVVYLSGRSLGAWAEEVAEDAGVDIIIDSSFYDIYSTGYITEVSHREALRLIAEAGNGIIVVDNDSVINLLPLPTEDVKETLDNDDIVDDSLSYTNENKYLGVEITKYTFSAASSDQELGYYEEISVTKELQELEITYSAYPAVVDTVQIFIDTTTDIQVCDSEGNALTASSGAYKVPNTYSDKVVIYLKLPSSSSLSEDTTFVTITGTPYNSATTTISRGSEIKNIKTIQNNYLITGDIAESVADYQYERVVNKYKYSAEVVTEKDFALGDKAIMVEDNIFVTGVGFEMSNDDQVITVEGIDE